MPASELQSTRRRGRGGESFHAVALPLRQRPRPVQHRGLAGARISLHPHHPVPGGQDQLHGFLLTLGQRSPCGGGRSPTSSASPGGPGPWPSRIRPIVSRSSASALSVVRPSPLWNAGATYRPFSFRRPSTARSACLHRYHPGLPGERGGQQVRPAEHRLPFRQMRHCPFYWLQWQEFFDSLVGHGKYPLSTISSMASPESRRRRI